MKRKIALVLSVVLLASTLLIGCGSDSETSSLDDRDTLIVGFDAEYPPYGYMDDNGDYTGFDIEMAKLVCESLGWECVLKPIDWDSKDMELESGTIDCIWNGFSVTPEREDQYAWSITYVDNSQVIVVPASSGITTLDELEGLYVAVQAGSSALEALNSDDCADWVATFEGLSEVADYNSAFMNMEAGAADAVAVDIAVAEYQLSIREEGEYVILEEAFYSEPYAIGFRVEDTDLRDLIDEEYMKLVEDGTYEALATQFEIDLAMLSLLD
ncbi:MAG: transporter substrate-binding domain-containing protein [Eubacteriales bacterium]